MGKEIVRQESIKYPGRRSRLWDPNEVYDVLTKNKGTIAVEGIWLDVDQISHMNLSSNVFENMPNLRVLAFQDLKRTKSVYLPNGLDLTHIDIKYLKWDGYPLKSLPSSFCPEMLVELSLKDSNLEKLWDGVLSLPCLEILDLSDSKFLMESPNLSGAPNLDWVKLNNCERLTHVDPSVFSLPKIDIIEVRQCPSLKILSSNTCSLSLRELHALGSHNLDISVPFTNIWMLSSEKIPSSISQIRHLRYLYFPINDSLMDLPDNFTDGFVLSDPAEHDECDTFITLQKVFPSPAFLTVQLLVFYRCDTLFDMPDNICLLTSLEHLELVGCSIIIFPQTIEYLPKLVKLVIDECNMLRYIPVLPRSIQIFRAINCKSLDIIFINELWFFHVPCNNYFILLNCIELDSHSYDTILEDAIARFELGARLHSSISKNKVDIFWDPDRDNGIWYLLPTMSNKFLDWFHYHSSQVFFSIELPSNLSGFFCYMVLSQGHINYDGAIGCECYFETSLGERINRTCFDIDQMSRWFNVKNGGLIDMMSDHVLLWYDAQYCKQIIDAVEYNPNVRFRFFVETTYDAVEIELCGFRWMFYSEDQFDICVFDKDQTDVKTKRSWDIHVLESNIVQNRAEGFEFDDEEEETSAPEVVQETKDSRCLLEELLHIGFRCILALAQCCGKT